MSYMRFVDGVAQGNSRSKFPVLTSSARAVSGSSLQVHVFGRLSSAASSSFSGAAGEFPLFG